MRNISVRRLKQLSVGLRIRGRLTRGVVVSHQESALASEFERLTEQWKADTEFESSVTRIAMHPAYQRIVGMGTPALPLILQDLQATRAAWFWALRAITGENPVPDADRGNIQRMIEAWVQWGIQKELLPAEQS